MEDSIYDFFAKDHQRLDSLLDKAINDQNAIDMDLYAQFRIGLLTHIAWEEKVLFKAAQLANYNVPLPLAKQLRIEHGAITSLLVPPPTPELLKVLRYILEKHDELEEKPGGMYEQCEKLTADQKQEILNQLKNFPEVPVHPNRDIPLAWDAAKRACARAGFDYDEILNM